MSNIPRPSKPFKGKISRLFSDSKPEPLRSDKTLGDAPNIMLVMLDDVGFGTCSTFGGPIPTPGVDKIASQGLLYNQFHTTALCSPTRASLLTGRNHHSVHMGGITEIANSFPAYDSAIPRETATIAEILRQSGYSTSCFGKWHLTPSWEQNPAGPFDRWPTGMGFERLNGFTDREFLLQTGLSFVILRHPPFMLPITFLRSGVINSKENSTWAGTNSENKFLKIS